MAHVVIGGASGMIGRALTAALRSQGVDVVRLVRRPPAASDERAWDPHDGTLNPEDLRGADAVVNLSGRSLVAPWTPKVRADILNSRVHATRLLAETIAKAPPPRPALVSASAIGYYGDRGEEILTETSSPGAGFLAEVVQAWEAEVRRAAAAGARVVCTRFGLILAPGGGFLKPLLTIFRLGLGGPVGSGKQWWSWVHLDDVIAALVAATRTPAFEGAINLVAPQAARNETFTRTLASVLRRPAVLRAPAFALRAALGAMADEMILAGQHVVPSKLQERGFAFRWPDLRTALENATGKGGRTANSPSR